ncbi:ecdysteroid kinase domain-containing protein [Ditylenchus destructor]|nr:ecdysteroid kinase domain-containing protein [Ditylenchus destructor]
MTGKDICGTNGFTSQIFLISIELHQENDKSSDQQTFSVIMKAFSLDRIEDLFKSVMNISTDGEAGNRMREQMESMKVKTCRIHNIECDFYSLFGNISKEIMPIPDIYYIQKTDMEKNTPGVIIMEDLTESGYYFEIPLRKLKNVMNAKQMAYSYIGCVKELGLPEILMHGDLWTNNLLWKRKADGSTPEKVAAFIDWQIVSKGNFAVDIARIVVVCCEPEVRKELESFILDYYYDEFSRRMHESGKPVGYGIEQLRKAYDYAFIIQGSLMGLMAKFFADMKKDESKDNIEILSKRAKIAVEDAVVVAERTSQDWLTV